MLRGITCVTALLYWQQNSKGINLQGKQAFRLCAKSYSNSEMMEVIVQVRHHKELCYLTPPDLTSDRSLKGITSTTYISALLMYLLLAL